MCWRWTATQAAADAKEQSCCAGDSMSWGSSAGLPAAGRSPKRGLRSHFPWPQPRGIPSARTASLCNSRPLPLALCLFLAGCNFSRPHGFSDCQGAPAKEQRGLAAPRSCLEAGSWCSLCRLLQSWRCPAAPHGSLCFWVASAQSCPQSLSHLRLHPAHSLRAPGGQIKLWGNLVGLFESSGKPPYRGTALPRSVMTGVGCRHQRLERILTTNLPRHHLGPSAAYFKRSGSSFVLRLLISM